MENIIIAAVLVVILGFAIRSGVKHFRGEGGCCGGGDYKARSKKLEHVIAKKTFTVEGMSCQHCVNRVTEAVQDIAGASAAVHLKKGEVVVSMDREIDTDTICAAIEKAGYQVVHVQ